jgi:hypothetical protein
MNGARTLVVGLVLAIVVAVAQQTMVRLVDTSGAGGQPALILVLLLAAFLGVLTAVATRMLRLPGATAPTILVLAWTLVPAILQLIPSTATDLFANDAALTVAESLALCAAVIAAAVTLGIPAER